ncbi:MAG: RNA-binding transcriptional accessory protein [Paludibacteraceae bacterium]|nr:RNA-binding transcriptional accessory protein [Paludibacteraceae bacterium]MBP3575467.1 RNA-binding transcriptional accessory protein [Paludibacteraceae bacterium]
MGVAATQVAATIALLNENATIPFIARYRKERTGSLDEVQISQIADEFHRYLEIDDRKATILNTIAEQGKLTDELRMRIEQCWDTTELEDIYLPYKPHRKTRADVAREQGYEPLAQAIFAQRREGDEAIKRLGKEREEALQGARDIIAEWINQDERARQSIRREFSYSAIISTKIVKGKESDPEAQKYKDYFSVSEPLRRITSHRLLAIRRAESEGFIRVDISPDREKALDKLAHLFLHSNSDTTYQVELAMEDSYKRLLKPAIETEFAGFSKERADTEAIQVFANNLRQLLLESPLGQKRVLAIDPGFRTGCKVVVLSAQGDLLHHTVVFLNTKQATTSLQSLIHQYQIQAIAIGNGTASRETEQMVRVSLDTIASTPYTIHHTPQIFVVSESGASVYSASKTAREEFPNEDVTVRGAVSIGRRLMDPLAELVKIDPKSIGVGQYQHDVNQTRLGESLQQTVESVVNCVGVDVNTASKHILTYISGLGPTLAQNIVNYRQENGAFPNRKALLKVPKMGAKTYEQAAGFLRVTNSDNPLDNSAVHPESYAIVERMAKDLHCTVADLMQQSELRKQIDLQHYVTNEVGIPTLTDILRELEKPSRDPRTQLEEFHFDESVHTIDDLQVGMILPGIITNIANFGAFCDIGVHKDGLIHVSEMANRRISSPNEVVSLHQHVRVRVIDIDRARGRIQLSLKQ